MSVLQFLALALFVIVYAAIAGTLMVLMLARVRAGSEVQKQGVEGRLTCKGGAEIDE